MEDADAKRNGGKPQSIIIKRNLEEADVKRNSGKPQSIVVSNSHMPANKSQEDDISGKTPLDKKRFSFTSMKQKIQLLYACFSKKSRMQKKWFAAGVIVFPIIVGILSATLYFVTVSDYDSRGMERAGEVQFDGMTHEVYEFQMPSRFQNEFPADNWRLKIRHDVSDEDYRLYSEDDYGYRDFAIIDDDDDSTWMKFDTRRDYDMRYVYLQVEEEVIRLAISPSVNEPTKVSYSYDVENIFFAFQWTVFVVWPICAFAAIKWGFATNRPEFAYGVMISGGIATLLILEPLFDMLDDGLLGELLNEALSQW